MVHKPYIVKLFLHQKRDFIHEKTFVSATYEIKLWEIEDRKRYLLGIKYSLYLFDPMYSRVLLGFDNHYPKGPHIHFEDRESEYDFTSIDKLISDFKLEVKKLGYTIENKKIKKAYHQGNN
ncbi:MAG: DUF6516 family protein [Bacteriovorax sp.]|jgi:hypothetical protein